MSEPGTQTNRSTSTNKCPKCRTKVTKGQSDCSTCSSSQTPERPEQTSTPLVPAIATTEPDWARTMASAMTDLSMASQASLDLLNRIVLQTSPVQPSTDVQGRTTSKRPRSETRSLSPVSSVSTPPLTGLLSISPLQGDTRSEGEWSDSEQELDPGLSTKLAAMVDSLVTAIRETFHIQDELPPSALHEVVFFPSKNVVKGFPLHEDFTMLLTKAWNRPDRRIVRTKRLELLYLFPTEAVTKWSSAAKVDPPITRLTKHTTIPVADGAAFRDLTNRKLEFLSKNAFEASGAALRSIFASAWVAKAISEWSIRLHQEAPVELQTMITQIAQAAKYLCDAALDAGTIIAHTTALTVAIRRAVWLKVWEADPTSKRSFANIPFSGLRLFGTKLDEIISDATGGKSTLLPQNRPRRPFVPRESASRFQSFHRLPANRFSSSSAPKTAATNHGKKPSFKPKPNWRSRSQPSKSSSSRQAFA